MRLVEYKKYKEFSQILKQREQEWMKLFYKLPEVIELNRSDEVLELSPDELRRVYADLLKKNKSRMNDQSQKIAAIIQHEKVSLKKLLFLLNPFLASAWLLHSLI